MSILQHAPRFTQEEAEKMAQDLYALEAVAEPLPSERDQNFLLTTPGNERFILKIANATEDRNMLEAENAVMAHLAGRVPFCPRVRPSVSSEVIVPTRSPQGTSHWVRLITHLPGKAMGRLRYHSSDLLADLGRCVGSMDRALSGFDHPEAHREFHWDLARGMSVVEAYRHLIDDPVLGKAIDVCADHFGTHVAPVLPELRRSVIHNDANDYNVLVGSADDPSFGHQHVTGIVDFGDLVHSYTAGNLAVAAAYAVLNKSDPLASAACLVRGYHGENPLTEEEVATLFGLIRLRLCVSACMAAHQRQQAPDNPYLAISQEPIRKALPILADIHPRFAEAVFREACGLAPVRKMASVCDWLRSNRDAFAPVVDVNLRVDPVAVLDLSVASPIVEGDSTRNVEPAITRRIAEELANAGARVAIGRYDEARSIYTAPHFTTADPFSRRNRTVHMGVDLFVEAGMRVRAPLAGKILAVRNNQQAFDYGPMVILEHVTGVGDTFYTLYGHLDTDCLTALVPGKAIGKGEVIGRVGGPAVNGGWTPHLHMQIILDLLDMGTGFPGVVRANERDVWRALSPDPNLILGIPQDRFPDPEPSKAETLRTRRQRIGRNLSIGYWDPVKVVRGFKQYLFDETGRRYLDVYNNVPHVGHCHPRVVEAATRQMSILNTNTRYLHDTINRYAERLCSTLPEPLRVCFFVNSASEGNELALRLARTFTGRRDMVVLEAAYHGHTTSLIDISPYKHAGPGGRGAPSWVHAAPLADVYRGPYKANDPQAGTKYAAHIGEIIDGLRAKGGGIAAFIAESCPSVGGQIFFPNGYLAEAYRLVRAGGGVCIADEVQTGYGRIGTHFYAFQAQGVVPDIVVLGKPIGNGHPISAVITTPEIAAAFDNGMEFFSTFGGNTVSCTVGLAVLDVLRDEDLQENALRIGRKMLAGMRPFPERYPIVGDVRGSGLFLGVELVRDRETLEPAADEASFVVNRMRECGILLGTDGPYHNVLKIRPPMPFNESNADHVVSRLDRILSESFGG